MFWPVWILKDKMKAFLLSQNALCEIILLRDLVITVSALLMGLTPWAIFKIIFIVSLTIEQDAYQHLHPPFFSQKHLE
jgi:hypothetical protein